MEFDNVPAFIVRDCASAFVHPLLYTFDLLILKTSTFTDIWKSASLSDPKKGF